MDEGHLSNTVSIFLGLMFAVVVFTSVARRLRLPHPSLLALGGLVMALFRGCHGCSSTPTWCCSCSCRRYCSALVGGSHGASWSPSCSRSLCWPSGWCSLPPSASAWLRPQSTPR